MGNPDYQLYKQQLLEWCLETKERLKQYEEQGQVDEREKVNEVCKQIDAFISELQEEQTRTTDEQSAAKIKAWQHQVDRLYRVWDGWQTSNKTFKLVDEETITEAREEESGSPLQPVPIGGHTLPPLPYAHNALEPYISAEIMRLHHSEHHQGYVDGLNKAEQKMEQARKNKNFELIRHWEREAAFNGAGHYLHTIFWHNMSPQGGGEASGQLAAQINRDFGGFQACKRHFTEAANEVEGVGWALLVWSPRSHRLEVLQAEKHQHFSQQDVVPILVLDVWEHAYYLQYKTKRKDYVKNWWHVVNWPDANQRFLQARRLRWTPY